MSRSQDEAEKLRWLKTTQGLQSIRADLQLRGVAFRWERVHRQGAPVKLIAELRGVAKKPDDHAALAMTLISPLFPGAVIEGGQKNYATGRWLCVLWLDPPLGETKTREQAHPELVEHVEAVNHRKIHEPKAGQRRCPHDGAGCKHGAKDEAEFDAAYAQMREDGTVPRGFLPPCHVSGCWRERRGQNLRTAFPGYPQPGHIHPAPGPRRPKQGGQK